MRDAVQNPDVNSRAVAWVGVAIVVAILFAALASWLMWHSWNPSRPDDGPNSPLDFKVKQPMLESAPQPALKAYLAGKERQLNSWGWVDRQAGIAHIPIGQAMQLAAQRGAPSASAGKKEKKR